MRVSIALLDWTVAIALVVMVATIIGNGGTPTSTF